MWGETAADALGFDYHLIRSDAIFNFTGLWAASPPTMFFGSAATYISIQSLNICKGSKVSRVSPTPTCSSFKAKRGAAGAHQPGVEEQTTKCNPNKSYKHSLYYQISLHYGNAPF